MVTLPVLMCGGMISKMGVGNLCMNGHVLTSMSVEKRIYCRVRFHTKEGENYQVSSYSSTNFRKLVVTCWRNNCP